MSSSPPTPNELTITTTTAETHPLTERITVAIQERQPLEEIQKLAGGAPAVQLALLYLEREERRIRTLQAELTTATARADRLGAELNEAVKAADAAGLLEASSAPPPGARGRPLRVLRWWGRPLVGLALWVRAQSCGAGGATPGWINGSG